MVGFCLLVCFVCVFVVCVVFFLCCSCFPDCFLCSFPFFLLFFVGGEDIMLLSPYCWDKLVDGLKFHVRCEVGLCQPH